MNLYHRRFLVAFLSLVTARMAVLADDAPRSISPPVADRQMGAVDAMKPGEMKPGEMKPGAPGDAIPPASPAAPGTPPAGRAVESASSEPPVDEARIDAMAARIDALLEAAWARQGIVPAPPASDMQFLRRVSLDLIGRIPRLDEAREFLVDRSPSGRRKLVERLLRSREHADYMAAVWHGALLPDVGGSTSLEPWLAGRFAAGAGYDQIARSIVTAAAKGMGEQALAVPLDRKPTELAAAVSRTFLGTQIQCAECHKHPTDVWTQDDFWGFAAFFGPVKHPQGGADVSPRFLGAAAPLDSGADGRQQLPDWLVSASNPWFAKAAVNRLWGLLFGAGIVHPIDDFGGHNPPADADVLEDLAGFFAAGGWNHRDVLRVLTRTRAYGLSGGDGRLFAAMPLEPLNAVQLYNSLATAYQAPRLAGNGRQANNGGQVSRVDQFLAKFRSAPGQEREYTAGIPQAITMMNGQIFDPMRAVYHEAMLTAANDAERVEGLFLATVSRPPVATELATCLEVLGRETTAAGRRMALIDIHWALVNSAEFAFSP